MSDELENTQESADSQLEEGKVEAGKNAGNNDYLRKMVDDNFLEYASYVIKDRAIPDVDDGLKPVQRRVLWALYQVNDGRTHKVANIVGNTMHYHPHGDASIGDALVVLANKEYYITKQGNFGNIITGSRAAAPRYIECALSPLGVETLFNNDITPFVPSYDGRSQEPVVLPVKIPSLLMLGSDGIAVGMATKILPHNFNELLNAQIACLRGESFELYPDFQQGGLMDASEYADGAGRITLRAKIELDGRRLMIREIPATTTTESLLASIEKAAEKSKIKISNVVDYTTKEVAIEVVPMRGQDPEKLRQALYMYTDCAVSISSNITVIKERRPCVMTVTEIIQRNTEKLLEYLKRELEIALHKQSELFHAKTLAQIFFENRIYKKIEECKTEEAEYKAVREGLAPFLKVLRREVTDADIDKLLALPVRRISRFDIEKNQTELREIEKREAELRHNLAHLTDYAVKYLQALLDKYGAKYPRRTEIEHFTKIDRKAAALNNIKIGWDRKNGYIGTAIKSDDASEVITCNEFDKLLLVRNDGEYKIVALPGNKEFIDKQMICRKHEPKQEYAVVYSDRKTKKAYGKRCVLGNGILDKIYNLIPANCRIELFAPRADAIYEMVEQPKRGGARRSELNLMTLPRRSAKARGVQIAGFPLKKLAQIRLLTEEELAEFVEADTPEQEEDAAPNAEAVENCAAEPQTPEAAPEAEPMPEAETPETPEVEPPAEEEPVAAPQEPTPPREEPPAPKKRAPRRKREKKAEAAEPETPAPAELVTEQNTETTETKEVTAHEVEPEAESKAPEEPKIEPEVPAPEEPATVEPEPEEPVAGQKTEALETEELLTADVAPEAAEEKPRRKARTAAKPKKSDDDEPPLQQELFSF